MYRLMRNVHLAIGLVFALALGVYLLSSVRLAHRSWFSPSPTVTEATFPVDPAQAGTLRALGHYLITEHGLRGEITRIDPADDGSFKFVIRRLGTNYQVQYMPGSAEAQVRTNRLAFIGMLMSMHFSHGFWHEDALINVWGAVLPLTSLALFAMGVTGIYLWFKTCEERLVGSVLLAVGLVFAITLMVVVRVQG
ncbi:MAG: hypothetical protein OXN89_05615 [Bryobacterales bacterium]|nr:hypothetical protein [Bryobacterales bacterium]